MSGNVLNIQHHWDWNLHNAVIFGEIPHLLRLQRSQTFPFGHWIKAAIEGVDADCTFIEIPTV